MPTLYGPVLLGYTDSTDLPTSAQSLQPNYAGGASDGFFFYLYTSQLFAPAAPEISYFGTSGENRITRRDCLVRLLRFYRLDYRAGTCRFTVRAPGRPWRPSRRLFCRLQSGNQTRPANPSAEIAQLILYGVRIFGGSGDDHPSGIATDSFHSGGYFISDETNSPNFPGLTGVSTAAMFSFPSTRLKMPRLFPETPPYRPERLNALSASSFRS